MRATLPFSYFTAEGIDHLTQLLPEMFPSLCSLIELPHPSREGRTIHGVRVGKARAPDTDMILLTGNVHARELGTAEFCVYFAYNLCQAYAEHDDLRCGEKTFTYGQIRTLIEGLNLIIVPCVNPDGRAWVMQGRQDNDHGMMLWRGNRQLDGGEACYGVDLNRNQDFLWDFPVHFANALSVDTTTRPCSASQTYRGTCVTSEPEAKNIVWLMEHYGFIYAYLDFHCAHGSIVYPWGHVLSQSSFMNQNFRNPAYDHQRDPDDPSYREYIPPGDLAKFRELGEAFITNLQQVRGSSYGLMAAIELGLTPNTDPHAGGWFYRGTSGANDDYAYSRHFVNANKAKIMAFTVEFGNRLDEDPFAANGFQPSMEIQMPAIIEELIAGTIGFCLRARSSLPSQAALLIAAAITVLVLIVTSIIQSCS